jgi:hypothetical protein
MERTRFTTPARAAEVATMCGSGWRASSELTQTTASPSACVRSQLRQEGARGVQHREELQVQLFGPGRVVGVGEGGDTALARVVDQHGSGAERRFAGGGEGACTEPASSTSQGCEKSLAFGCCLRRPATAASSRSALRPHSATEAPQPSSSSTVARPMPDEPPVTTATRPARASAAKKVVGVRLVMSVAGVVGVIGVVGVVGVVCRRCQALRSGTTLAVRAGE